MKKLFGTDGIRGLAGSEQMNRELAYSLGRALARYCQQNKIKPEIIIGRDTRESGPFLEMAVRRGITAAGGRVILAGIIPTSAIAFLAKKEKTGLGLIISASHNPYEYNGFKIFKADGVKLTDAEEMEIEKLIAEENNEGDAEPDPETAAAMAAFVETALNDYNNKYVEFLTDIIEKGDFKGMKIVLDCANGATYKVAPLIFKSLGAEVTVIFNKPNGKNINENCGSEHTENLKKAVLENSADAGLAFDGDGDRLAAINEKGERLTGDHLLYICAKLLKEKKELKNNTVVSTTMSNIGFINALKKLGINHLATDVGDRQVYAAAIKTGAILGGEESGHIMFLDRHTTGDGILSGLTLLQAMKYFNKPLSELAGEITLLPKILINFKVKAKPELKEVPEIIQAIAAAEKHLGASGRVLVRYSGTEPLCRVMIEGKNESEIKDLAEKIGLAIKNNLN